MGISKLGFVAKLKNVLKCLNVCGTLESPEYFQDDVERDQEFLHRILFLRNCVPFWKSWK